MPPQPPGIWNSVYNDAKWTDATGPDRYRRAIYTFIKRTSGYPSALMFDASDRDTSLPRRIATNTPLASVGDVERPGVSGSRAGAGATRDEGYGRKSIR